MPRSHPVIPVLDLMIGQIVLARGGKRDDYLPVNSKLTRSSQPLDVAKAIFQQTSCDTMYLADIDSFAGAEPNWRVFNQLLDAGFKLWIDANWLKNDRWSEIPNRIQSLDRLKVIVSTETMNSVDDLRQVASLKAHGIAPIFSLDQIGEATIAKTKELSEISPLEWVQHAVTSGIDELIILDLSKVGTSSGVEEHRPICDILYEIRNELPEIELTSGGGVRSAEDVSHFLKLGCDHVLVASAIHDCRLTPADIEALARESS